MIFALLGRSIVDSAPHVAFLPRDVFEPEQESGNVHDQHGRGHAYDRRTRHRGPSKKRLPVIVIVDDRGTREKNETRGGRQHEEPNEPKGVLRCAVVLGAIRSVNPRRSDDEGDQERPRREPFLQEPNNLRFHGHLHLC